MSQFTGDMLTVIDIPGCCGAPSASAAPAGLAAQDETTRFHFALNVSDLERSVEFYRILFDTPPAKHHRDYAKFEVEQPPLVFSLMPNAPSSGGSLSHFGFPVDSVEDLAAAAERLSSAGLEIHCQTGTVCGYARQDKVWVADPDHNFWEIYVVFEDVDPATVRAGFDGIAPPPSVPASQPESRVVWEHRVLDSVPERIPYEDETVDEVWLQGLFNGRLSADERWRLLQAAVRGLRPGGLLFVHGLVADGPLNEMPKLPGVAALVQRVPETWEPIAEITEAGLESVRITKLPESPVFQAGSIGLREIKLEARKPFSAADGKTERIVLYKGPFASAVDDDGQVFPRGRRIVVSQRSWDRLAAGAAASQFLFLAEPCSGSCGCG